MKRALLLIPVIAIIVIACRQKHATTTATPPAPDYTGISHVEVTTNTTTTTMQTESGSTYTSTTTTTSSSDTVVTTVMMPKDSMCRLVVSFFSKGEGIDLKSKGMFDKWLSKDQVGIVYTTSAWGREGEINYCFKLNNKTAQEQVNFVNDVKNLLTDKELIHIYEFTTCDKPQWHSWMALPSANANDTARLVVSFLSTGQGTDREAREILDNYLVKHADLKYEVVNWGREGEVDYVFRMKDRDAQSQSATCKEIRNLMGRRELVRVQENFVPHPETKMITETAPAADSNTVRLVVSFISKGQGIDYKTEESFKNWLAERNTIYETTRWGREGEINYCFRLANMDTRQQEIFVRDVRTFVGENDLVLVSEWAICDKRK